MITALGACAAPSATLPPEPAAFSGFAYSPFKGDVRTRYGIEQTRILAAIPDSFADLDIHQRLMPRTVPAATVKAHYDRALTGWRALPGLPSPWGGWAYGYRQDARVFVVFGTPADAAGRQPVGIITNLKPGNG